MTTFEQGRRREHTIAGFLLVSLHPFLVLARRGRGGGPGGAVGAAAGPLDAALREKCPLGWKLRKKKFPETLLYFSPLRRRDVLLLVAVYFIADRKTGRRRPSDQNRPAPAYRLYNLIILRPSILTLFAALNKELGG